MRRPLFAGGVEIEGEDDASPLLGPGIVEAEPGAAVTAARARPPKRAKRRYFKRNA